ncbi:MAG: hypothetical protein M3N34_01015 [Pseudomonadota bacterium]|nr:hypothetical protein [Pseudomonadota bacterium]
MDADRLNARIYAGRGKAAARIGHMTRVYRPADALNPLANLVALLPVAYNAVDGKYASANSYGKVVWYADFDASQAVVGDYLVSTGANNPFANDEMDPEYFFVAAKQSLLPIVAVACNRFIRITRPAALAANAAGATGYSGISATGMIDVLGAAAATNGGQNTGWPCAMILGGTAAHMKDPLPAGAALGVGWMIYLPPSVPVALLPGDRVIDDTGRVLVIEGAELTSLGYRLQANEAHS